MSKGKAVRRVLLTWCEEDAELLGPCFDAATVLKPPTGRGFGPWLEEMARELDLWAMDAGINEFVIAAEPRRPGRSLALRGKNPQCYSILSARRFQVRATRSKWQIQDFDLPELGKVKLFYLPPESGPGGYTPERDRGGKVSIASLLRSEAQEETS